MHVLIDARMVANTTHGIARYALNLIASMQSEGVHVTALVSSTESQMFIERWTGRPLPDVVVCRYPFQHPLAPLEMFQYLRGLKRAAARHRKASGRISRAVPDVIHFTSYSVPLFLPLTGFAARTIITIHDLIHILPVRDPVRETVEAPPFFHRLYFKTIVEPALRSCHKVIAVSPWTKETLVKQMGIPEKHVAVIFNGIENSWLEPLAVDENHLRKKWGLKKPYVVCVSNLKPHKNVLTLMRACAQIWAEIPEVILEDNRLEEGEEYYDFELVLAVGSAELPIAWGEDWRNHPRVRVITGLTDQELQALYAYALCTVQPSQYEGYSFPVAETLAVGGAVLASEASAHKDFNSKAEGLTFYQPFESSDILARQLKKVLKSRQLRTRESRTQKVRPIPQGVITMTEMAKQTLGIYKGLPK